MYKGLGWSWSSFFRSKIGLNHSVSLLFSSVESFCMIKLLQKWRETLWLSILYYIPYTLSHFLHLDLRLYIWVYIIGVLHKYKGYRYKGTFPLISFIQRGEGREKKERNLQLKLYSENGLGNGKWNILPILIQCISPISVYAYTDLDVY